LFSANAARAELSNQAKITGPWATQGYGAQIVIESCGDTGAELCGQIAWLWTDRDERGQQLKDIQNPDERLRDRPLVGVPIFRNFDREADGRWRGDGIYNPEDGNSYSASLAPRPDGTLEVTGCVLGIFCQTQIWRRPQSVCPAVATLTHQD
jgi:uncharacterized protein (DUF2147 family)